MLDIIEDAVKAMAENDQKTFKELYDLFNDEQKIYLQGYVDGYTTALRQVSMAENDS